MSIGRAIAAGVLAASLAGATQARPFCSAPQVVRLPPVIGARGSAVFETHDHIEPGDLACFQLDIPAARTLHVTVASSGNAAAFRLYPRGWSITRADRRFSFGADALPKATEADDARRWTGPAPQGGSALVVIGMKGGGGQYRLHVEVY